MWPISVSLRWLTIAASVVDLPEPVGPVTSTMPRGKSEMDSKIFGALRSSSDNILEGMVRMTAPAPRLCTKALTRKRASPGTSKEKSISLFSSYSLRCWSFMMSYTRACTSLCSIGGRLILRISPCTRIIGGKPAERCKSEALFLTLKASSSVISIIISHLFGSARCSGCHAFLNNAGDYDRNPFQLASCARRDRSGSADGAARRCANQPAGGQQDRACRR